MKDGSIQDSWLSASSFTSNLFGYTHGAQQARFNDTSQGASLGWIPNTATNAWTQEWLQVDLQRPTYLSGIETLGVNANNLCVPFACPPK